MQKRLHGFPAAGLFVYGVDEGLSHGMRSVATKHRLLTGSISCLEEQYAFSFQAIRQAQKEIMQLDKH
jgi:hypothetical protein